MSKVTKFPISHAQRELNRRGSMSLNCIVSDRWIKVGKPHFNRADLGVPIEIDVMAAYSRPDGGDRKLCSLIITVDELRKVLKEIDGER